MTNWTSDQLKRAGTVSVTSEKQTPGTFSCILCQFHRLLSDKMRSFIYSTDGYDTLDKKTCSNRPSAKENQNSQVVRNFPAPSMSHALVITQHFHFDFIIRLDLGNWETVEEIFFLLLIHQTDTEFDSMCLLINIGYLYYGFILVVS